MRDRDHGAAVGVDEPLEDLEAGEVEVVGGLVEQQHVDARQQQHGQPDARRLAAREGAHRHAEPVRGEADVGQRRARRGRRGRRPPRARNASRASEYSSTRPGSPASAAVSASRRSLRRGHAGAPRQVLGDGLVRGRAAALVEQADPQRRRRPQDPALVGGLGARHHAQQRRLADAVRPDHPDAGVVGDQQRDGPQHRAGPVGLRDPVEREHRAQVADRRTVAARRAARLPRVDMDLLTALARPTGTSGREDRVRDVVRPRLEELCDRVETDPLGNLMGIRAGGGPRLMLAAHMDEIGLMVTHIDDKRLRQGDPDRRLGRPDARRPARAHPRARGPRGGRRPAAGPPARRRRTARRRSR